MFLWQCCFHLIIAFISRGCTHTVILQPLNAEVVENGSISLTCYSPDITGIQTQSSWKYSKIPVLPTVVKTNNACTATGFISNNPDLYAWSCPEDNTFVITLKHVNLSVDQNSWMCRLFFVDSNVVTVSVKVPVKTATITSHNDDQVTTEENVNTTLKCQTAPSRPISALSWFLSDPDMKKTINITDASRQSPQAGESDVLKEVESVLSFRFSREHNGWHVYCQAANIPDRSVNSSTKVLFIIYPPDGPPALSNRHNGDVHNVIEYQQANLSCSVKGGNPLANLTWQCFNGQVTRAVQNDSVISKNTWRVLRNQQNRSCTCVSEHTTGNFNVSVSVKVLYPPDKPIFRIQTHNVHKIIEIIHNKSLTVNCTSDSNPSPDYVWFKRSDEIGNGQILNIDRPQQNDSGEYECRVNNTMVDSDGLTKDGSNSSNITLRILFPPNTPRFIYIDMKEHVIASSFINVIKEDRFTISCQSDSQPRPDYKWENGAAGNTSDIIATESVNKTCTATNIMRETVDETRTASASATLSVIVLYNPTLPQIYISNQTGDNHNVSKFLKVLEDDSFHLLCTSHGRPNPHYKWYFRNSEASTQNKLVIKNINRQQSGQYRCQASNKMLRTFGEEENGSSEINTTLDVLYPAEVDILTNTTVTEGDFINITCPVIKGNPPVTTVKWYPAGELGDTNSSVLYISNISRSDEKLYSCSVTTTINPTYGLATKKENFRHFNLIVNYEARVTNFYIGEDRHEDVYTVNEKDNVTFKCDIDSKPAPNATIFVNDRVIFLTKDNNMIYMKNNIQCSDFGIYRCLSINDYNNGRPSARNLTLFINCSPRRSPFIVLKNNLTSARNASVTFSFTALAYPEPGPAGLNWSFINGSEAVPLSNSSNVLVTSSQLQSNLTIRNVTQENYGHYLLTIRNTAGVFEQNFFLHQNVSELMQSEKNKISSSDTTVVVVGAMSGVVVIVALLVVGGLLYRKRRHDTDTGKLLYANIPFTGKTQNKKTKCEKSKVKETPFEGLQEIDDVPIITKEPVEYYNSKDVLETIDRIKVSDLFTYLTGKDEDSFGIDYQKLPTGLEKPCTFARKPENLAMNRYNGIYPYDHSRVKLHGDPDFFINACYIDGYKRTKAYIASLGPTAKTTSDFKTFWQMIWHEQSDIIVMLTNLREPSV